MASSLRLVVDIQVLLSDVTGSMGPSFELWQAARRFNVVLVLCEGHFSEAALKLVVETQKGQFFRFTSLLLASCALPRAHTDHRPGR